MFVDDCHCIAPTFPDMVNTVEFVPVQTEVAPKIFPATEVGEIFIAPETSLVTAGEQVTLTTQ